MLGDLLPNAEDMKRLVYTARVLKESMRLFPPAWTSGRQANADVTIGGYRIPKGAHILVSHTVEYGRRSQ